MSKIIINIVQYVGEGFARIFSPSDDGCPAIGVQPFSGMIYHHDSRFDW